MPKRAHSCHSQALPNRGYNSKSRIVEIGTTTPCSKYVGKKAEARPGGQKKLIEGNICDWNAEVNEDKGERKERSYGFPS